MSSGSPTVGFGSHGARGSQTSKTNDQIVTGRMISIQVGDSSCRRRPSRRIAHSIIGTQNGMQMTSLKELWKKPPWT